MKWTEDMVKDVVKECRLAGIKASNEQLAKLMGEGVKWTVRDGFTGKVVGGMLDVCGFAWLKISAQQGFYRVAKKVAQDNSLRFTCGKDYPKGGRFNVYDTNRRQEMSVNEASARAIADVLISHGVKGVYVQSRID